MADQEKITEAPAAPEDRKRPRPATSDEPRVWKRMEWFQRQIEMLWQERDALARRVAELERAPRDGARAMEYVDARFATMNARWDSRFDDIDVRLARIAPKWHA